MMRRLCVCAAVIAVAPLLSACAGKHITERQFNLIREDLSADKEKLAENIAECTKGMEKRFTSDQRNAFSAILNVAPGKVASTLCERISKGVVSGRISYRAIVDTEKALDR